MLTKNVGTVLHLLRSSLLKCMQGMQVSEHSFMGKLISEHETVFAALSNSTKNGQFLLT